MLLSCLEFSRILAFLINEADLNCLEGFAPSFASPCLDPSRELGPFSAFSSLAWLTHGVCGSWFSLLLEWKRLLEWVSGGLGTPY